MRLDHSFMVPVPMQEAWPVLLDVPRIALCMPGATLDEVDGNEFRGRVRVKVGPITVSYQGTAHLAEVDAAARKVVMDANGKESRGSGSVKATITAILSDAGGQTRVEVATELAITGKPAQFGRGLMTDIGGKIIDQFAARLAEEIAREPAPQPPLESATAGADGSQPQTVVATASKPAASQRRDSPLAPRSAAEAEPAAISLLSTVGPALLKRGALVALVIIGAIVLWRIFR